MDVEATIEDDKPKYIVTKADGTPVDDAVVIRLKDPFAAPALYSYANTIMTMLEVGADMGMGLEAEEYQRMLDIADYFHERGVEAESIKGKRLPD
jgi:hypothetical protein